MEYLTNVVRSKNVDISTDPFNGRNPSYCFVDLHDGENACLATEILPGQLVRGRPVKVNFNTKTNKRRPTPTAIESSGQGNVDMSTDALPPQSHIYDRWNCPNPQDRWIAPLEESRRLFVGGLPLVRTQPRLKREMRELFEGVSS